MILDLLFCLAALTPDIHTVEGVLEHGGYLRSYHLHIPNGLDPKRPVPLVFVFHGGGGWGLQVERFTDFSALSDKAGFVACYPDAVERNWNDGRVVQESKAHREKIDDAGFIDALIDVISKKRPIDPKRIFATGISNGGFFSNYLGAKLSRRFAAIAPVVGGMAPAVAVDFKPDHPVSVLIFQGTADPLVPFDGGMVQWGRGDIVSTKTVVRKWVEANGCKDPVEDALPDKDPGDGTTVKRSTYGGGRDGAEVVLYTIVGGGHTWPGGAQYLPEFMVGRVCKDIDGNQVIWEFFKAHPKP